MEIRAEAKGDAAGIRKVLGQAFGSGAEASLVDKLRGAGAGVVSLVAEDQGLVVGHIYFTRVGLQEGGEQLALLGLGPMGVLPERQRQGIGSRLVAAGLEACREEEADAVVIVGHPEYYPRFGFRPASAFGLRCEFPIPAELFMALELRPGALAGHRGLVRYAPEFGRI
jgi:putative acetyltransferase